MGIRNAGVGLMLAALAALPARSQPVSQERIEFAPGETSATVEGAVSGSARVEYQFAGSAGQDLVLELEPGSPQAFFDLYAPGTVPGEGRALFTGPRAGLRFTGALKTSGDYTVEVFLPPASARRGDSTAYVLTASVTGQPTESAAISAAPAVEAGAVEGPESWTVGGLASDDALKLRAEPSSRAAVLGEFADGTVLRNLGCKQEGTQHWCQVATVEGTALQGWAPARFLHSAAAPGSAPSAGLRCAAAADQPVLPCAFEVAHPRAGQATVFVTLPEGGRRRLYFVDGAATGSDAAAGFKAEHADGVSVLTVGGERFEVPDALLAGN